MKKLDNYQLWNKAFYHLGAKGSPENNLFDFSREEFFIKGTIFSENDPRTTSAFAHWVCLFGKNLNPNIIKDQLNNLKYDPAWLGYYLDLINHSSFNELYEYANPLPEIKILYKVREPDQILLKWGLYSKPLSEKPEKYLHLDKTKTRFF